MADIEAASIFSDKSQQPDLALLGDRRPLWEGLVAAVEDSTTSEWSFYKKSTGWILLLKAKKKTICTLMPKGDVFIVIFLIPERGIEVAMAADFPPEVKTAMKEAKRYSLGCPFNVEVRNEADLAVIRDMAAIKVSTWKR